MHVLRACPGCQGRLVSLLMLLLPALGAAKEGKQSEMWLVRRLLPSFWRRNQHLELTEEWQWEHEAGL